MGPRALLLPTLAALALSYGLTTRHAGILPPAAPSAGEPDRAKKEGIPDSRARDWTATPQSSRRAAYTERRTLNGISEDVDWPGPPIPADIESEDPSIDVGEPLEVDDEWGAELALIQEEPIDIGADLDVGDPLVWALEAASEPPVDIGAPLDAEDHEASGLVVAAEEAIEIGHYLDADDPLGLEPDEAGGALIELRDFIDAGVPRQR